MKKNTLLTAAALSVAAVSVLTGCTSAATTTASSADSPTPSVAAPTAVNTPASPQDAAAAAKNDNKCTNNVAWMTFDDGKPDFRELKGSCESVIVFGNKGHLTVEKAGSVTVMGDHNTVKVDSVGKIDFEGTDNTIMYGGTKPQVLEAGMGNTLTAR